MALQGAAKSVLSVAGLSKVLGTGCMSRLNDGIAGMSFSDREEEKKRNTPCKAHASSDDLARKLRFLSMQDMRGAPASSLGAAAAASIMAARHGITRGSLMLPGRSLRLSRPAALPYQQQQQQQRRHLNSWSAAQRYFVEGDHVINAEVNRTFQFTGLDSGSFYPFLVYTTIATAIATVFMVLPWLVAPQRVDLDKSSAYECGFDAFGEARQTFSVSFYLVSIMYLLFDIEIVYLFPYVMCHANAQMFWTMNLFLSLLVVGFVYEWGVGALEWRS